jgi:uncharacterized membrane protein YccC
MPIDPVILLTEEIRIAQERLDVEHRDAGQTHENELARSCLLQGMYDELLRLVPTSAPGAGELVRIAAEHLPSSHGRRQVALQAIADRLRKGQRLHADLVWLRALTKSLQDTLREDEKCRVIGLLSKAILGAARPITIFRAAGPYLMVAPQIVHLAVSQH